MKKKLLKIGTIRGESAPPYLWNVLIFDLAFKEVMEFLSEEQYRHLRMQFQDLARSEEPSRSDTVDVKPIENFYELRDKGGILGNLNVRVFFGIDKRESPAIVVLGAIVKKNDGQTPAATKILMKRRFREYSNGNYGR